MRNASGPHARKILCVVGARPNFMKMAPVLRALAGITPSVAVRLLHTGQHYDATMSQQYFEALGMQAPDINLEVGSASHAAQTADIMARFEPVLDAEQPAAVLVVGDVNSTLACALVAAKKNVPVMHVEAGLRSFDRSMPEEVNRVLTDQMSALLFVTEPSGRENLLREGIDAHRIHFVGNVMIDSLRQNLARAVPAAVTLAAAGHAQAAGAPDGYALLTLHRPSNVDDGPTLRRLLETASIIGQRTPVVFPVHPRTRAQIERHGLTELLAAPAILALPPAGYLDMLGLMQQARLVLTDSGGVQEETTALGIPCITLRENTERPVTVDEGTNTIAGTDRVRILAIHEELMQGRGKAGRIPRYWDGNAAGRIADAVGSWLNKEDTTS